MARTPVYVQVPVVQGLDGGQHHRELNSAMQTIHVLRSVAESATGSCAGAAQRRFFASAACGLPGVNSADVRRAGGRVCDRVAAHARLHVEALRTPRPAHGTVGLVL